MILLIHVIIALASILYTGYVYLSPSKNKLAVSYALVGLTVLTGTALVFQNQAYLLQACISGLLFLGAEFLAIAMARRKLAAATLKIDTSRRG